MRIRTGQPRIETDQGRCPALAVPTMSVLRGLSLQVQMFYENPSARYSCRLAEAKGRFCVSTVSVVCTFSPCPPARKTRRILADAADGTDGAASFLHRSDRDEAISRSALTAERNLNADCPQERLSATQAARKGTRIFRPAHVGR